MRMRFASTLVVFAGLVFASAPASAQQALRGTVKLPPQLSKALFPVSRIDTRSFHPQIDDAYVYHPEVPENPMEIPKLAGLANNLRAGSIMNHVRIGTRALWPAITGTGWTPPDPDLAVGKNNVVATVNSSIAFFDKAGNKQFQQTASTFFSGLGAGTFLYDPKCIYDRSRDRFVIVFLEEDDASQTSKVLLAVSNTGDPNGTWNRYRLEAKLTIGTNSYWLDYPGLGYNKDAYVVCGNMFGFSSGWAGVQFLVIPADPVASGGAATVYSLQDQNGASAQIAETIDPTVPFVYGCSVAGTNALRVYSISSPGTAPALSYTTVAVPSFSTPSMRAPSTSGQTLDPLDGRIFNCIVRNNHLVAGHCIQIGSMLNSRWYDIDLSTWPGSGSPALHQSGNLGAASEHYFSPAVNMNASGAIGAIFSGSSSTISADVVVAGRAPYDPLGMMGLPVVLENSAGNRYTEQRWGDYFGCDVDPVDDTTFYGIAMDIASNNDWKTSIFSWTVTSNFPHGTVTLQDFVGDKTKIPVTIELRTPGTTTVVETDTVYANADGTFSFTTSLTGTYDVTAKASHWLRSKIANVAFTATGTVAMNFSLVNGDVNGDNTINIADLNAISAAWRSTPGSAKWNANADLNGDGTVNIADWNIVSKNWRKAGS